MIQPLVPLENNVLPQISQQYFLDENLLADYHSWQFFFFFSIFTLKASLFNFQFTSYFSSSTAAQLVVSSHLQIDMKNRQPWQSTSDQSNQIFASRLRSICFPDLQTYVTRSLTFIFYTTAISLQEPRWSGSTNFSFMNGGCQIFARLVATCHLSKIVT